LIGFVGTVMPPPASSVAVILVVAISWFQTFLVTGLALSPTMAMTMRVRWLGRKEVTIPQVGFLTMPDVMASTWLIQRSATPGYAGAAGST
jgi:hypothetical protein